MSLILHLHFFLFIKVGVFLTKRHLDLKRKRKLQAARQGINPVPAAAGHGVFTFGVAACSQMEWG